MEKPKDWFTIPEVLDYVKIKFNRHWTKTNIYLLRKEGKLQGFKIGSARFFLKNEIDNCVAGLTKPSPNMAK